MLSETRFYGGAKGISTAGDYFVHPMLARVYRVTTLGGVVFLPDARYLQTGGPVFIIVNTSGGAIDVADRSNTNTWNIPNNFVYWFSLIDNTSDDGRWQAKSNALNTGRTANHITRSAVVAPTVVTPLVVDCTPPAWKLVPCQVIETHPTLYTRTDLSLYVGQVITAQDDLYYSVSVATSLEANTEEMTTITVVGGPYAGCPGAISVTRTGTGVGLSENIAIGLGDFDHRRIRIDFTTFVVEDSLVVRAGSISGRVLFATGFVTTLSATVHKIITITAAETPINCQVVIGDVGSGWQLDITADDRQ